MSDQFDPGFEQLRGQHPPAPFASPTEVRRRGRARSRRHAIAAVVAVLALAGGGAGWASTVIGSGPPSPPAGPPATLSPQPRPAVVQIPEAWFLAGGDLPGDGWEQSTNELFEAGPPTYWSGCGSEQLGSLAQRLDVGTVSWKRAGSEADLVRVDQIVELFPAPPVAARNLVELRDLIVDCPPASAEAAVSPTYWEVVGDRFAGDESLLVAESVSYFDANDQLVPPEVIRYIAVVRVAEAVATLVSGDEALLREVAVTAAGRLATDPPAVTEAGD